MSNTAKGAGLGAVVGAGAGTLFGGNDAKNAALGALAGGVLGAAIGGYMDHQEQEMRESLQGTGIEIQRTAENRLDLTMPGDVLFAFNSANLTPQAMQSLDSVANVLNHYPESTVVVTGHTDDIGKDAYNQRLSEQRAESVAKYLAQRGVNPARISQQGMGKRAPKFPNTSEENRARNRRVELAIIANQNAGGAAPAPQQQPVYGPQSGSYPQPQPVYSPQSSGYPSQPGSYGYVQPAAPYGASPQTQPGYTPPPQPYYGPPQQPVYGPPQPGGYAPNPYPSQQPYYPR